MNKRIIPVVLASVLVAGLVGTVAFAQNDNGRAIVLPEVTFTDNPSYTTSLQIIPVTTETDPVGDETSMIEDTTVTTDAPEEPDVPEEYAKGIVFKADSGYTASTYTGYVGGIAVRAIAGEILSALENSKGVEVSRFGKVLGADNEVLWGDSLVLRAEDGAVLTELSLIFMGDVDETNTVNLADVSAMLKSVAGWNIEINEVAADVDGSGNVNLADVSTVLKKIAGWNVEFTNTPVLPGKYEMVNKGDVACHGTPGTEEWVPLCLSDGIHYDLGVKFNVAENEFVTSITFLCPSWGDDKGKMTISVYKWTGDYNTSIAAMPIVSETFIDYKDNATLTLDLTDTSGKGLAEGEYVWRIHDGSDAGEGTGVGIWYFSELAPAESTGMKTFLNCEEFNIGPVANIYYATAK